MKKNFNRLLTMLAAVIMVMAFSIYVNAAPDNLLAEDYTGKTVILQSNDVHGEIVGYQYIAGLRDELEKRGAEVILADCGDWSQGSPYVGFYDGASAIKMMNTAGYDIAELGNHEFDFGNTTLDKNIAAADFPILCCDLVMNKDGSRVYDGTKIIRTNGFDDKKDTDDDLKIGFIGILTPTTSTTANPTFFKDRSFLTDSSDPTLYSDICRQIDTMSEDKGADIIVALSHLGVEGSYTSYDLLNNVQSKIESAIDIVLDGHSHTVMTTGSKGEPIISTGTKFANIGVVVIDEKDKSVEKAFLYPLKENTSSDPAKPSIEFIKDLPSNETVAQAADGIIAETEAQLGEEFAETKVFLNGFRSHTEAAEADSSLKYGNRDGETNLGDLVTDAFVWYVKKEVPEIAKSPENVIAIQNGGAIRASIAPGKITMKDINSALPFENTLYVIKLKGSDLLEALEASTYSSPEALGGFPQVSGMKYEILSSAEYDKGEQYPDSTFYGPRSIKRIKINEVNGKPFNKNTEYTIIANDFCAVGGDTYYPFARAESKFDTGCFPDIALIEYIADAETGLNGVIGDEYAKPAGRITYVSSHTKDANPMTVKAKTVKASSKKKTVIKAKKAFTVKNNKGKVTYKKLSGNKKITIAKNGKITVKKGLKAKTYKVKVRVTAAGNDSYKKGSQKVTLKVKVRKK